MTPVKAAKDRLHGTLDVLVLRALASGPRHGYDVVRWIEERTRRTIMIEDGSLYPSLYRMEQQGWVRASWGMSELGRRAKFYTITARGRRQLERETAEWTAFVNAVALALLPTSR